MGEILYKEKTDWVDLSDVSVFRKHYQQTFVMLKYFGMQYLPDEEAVSDLIQDIWLKIWEKKEMRINEVALKKYLFQSLYRAIINYSKHQHIVQGYEEKVLDNVEVAYEEEVTYKMIEAEIYQAINRTFSELPPSSRRVYAASLRGKSQKEISEELSISINTVKKHINNANHFMKKRLKNLYAQILFFVKI